MTGRVRARQPTVLALRALGLGDLFAGVPAIRALRRAFPDHRLLVAAPAWQRPVLALVGVDEVVAVGELEPLPRTVDGAEVAVDLHGNGPASASLLVARRPGRLVCWASCGVAPIEHRPRWRDGEHERERWCRLLRESGIPADPDDLLVAPSAPPPGRPPTALLHPGAAAPGRRWPVERFAAVGRALVDGGWRVAVTGAAAERGLAAELAARLGERDRVELLAGRTDLAELHATVATAGLLVCGDTGIAHVASATRTPSVVLFGPVDPAVWGPPASGPHVALWAGRRGDPHAADLDPGLAAIGVDDVLAAVDRLGLLRPPGLVERAEGADT